MENISNFFNNMQELGVYPIFGQRESSLDEFKGKKNRRNHRKPRLKAMGVQLRFSQRGNRLAFFSGNIWGSKTSAGADVGWF